MTQKLKWLLVFVLVGTGCDSDGKIVLDASVRQDAIFTVDASKDCIDPDRDGYGEGPDCLGDDCAPNDSEVNSGREEVCDTVDNNCNGTTDELPECERPRLWVFVLAGQSNMVGLGVNSELPGGEAGVVANTFIYYNDSIHPNPNTEQWLSLSAGFGVLADRFGPELKFGRQLQTYWPGRKIAIIKVAEGGTALHDRWDAPNGDLYQLMLSEVQTQLAGLSQTWRPQVMGFVWMQGESDAIDQSDALAYHDNLTDLLTSVRTEFDVEVLPTTMGLIAATDLWPRASIVRGATSLVALEMGQMQEVETNDLPRHPADPAHYNTQGTLGLGQRFADTMLSLLPTEFHFQSGFGAAQGDGFWMYRERQGNVSTPMQYNLADERWEGSASAQFIGPGWMHPGESGQAELVWSVPYAGLAEIVVTVSAGDNGGGDGTLVEIARDGSLLWGPTAIPNNGSEQYTFQRFLLQGQELQFRTSAGVAHDNSNDTTSWQIGITMLNVDG